MWPLIPHTYLRFTASALTQKAYRNIVRQTIVEVYFRRVREQRLFVRPKYRVLGQKYGTPLTNCTIRSDNPNLVPSWRPCHREIEARGNLEEHVIIIIQMRLTFLRVQYIRRIRWQGRTVARTQTRLYWRKRTSRARRIPKTMAALSTYMLQVRFYRENYFEEEKDFYDQRQKSITKFPPNGRELK